MSVNDSLEELIRTIPKAELHCHLEGSIPPSLLLDLAERNSVQLPFSTASEARDALEFDDLSDFIDFFYHAASVLRTPADFRDVVLHLASESRRQNVRYREVTFSFGYYDQSVAWDDVIQGLSDGQQRAESEYDVEFRFVAGIVRTNDPANGVAIVDRAAESRDTLPIAAIGMGGKETGYPAHRHEEAYDRAVDLGFHRMAHAGETVGPPSIWDALLALDIERVDHGIRAVEDDILLEYLAIKQIPLTVCPVSNVALGVYESMAQHPVRSLIESNIPVTVNSDDPALFQADLVDNYRAVASEFDLVASDIEQLARNSFEYSFLPEQDRREYVRSIEAEVR